MTPAGWYQDQAGQMRWWDGRAWTSHVQPALQQQAFQQPTRLSGPRLDEFPAACMQLLRRHGRDLLRTAGAMSVVMLVLTTPLLILERWAASDDPTWPTPAQMMFALLLTLVSTLVSAAAITAAFGLVSGAVQQGWRGALRFSLHKIPKVLATVLAPLALMLIIFFAVAFLLFEPASTLFEDFGSFSGLVALFFLGALLTPVLLPLMVTAAYMPFYMILPDRTRPFWPSAKMFLSHTKGGYTLLPLILASIFALLVPGLVALLPTLMLAALGLPLVPELLRYVVPVFLTPLSAVLNYLVVLRVPR